MSAPALPQFDADRTLPAEVDVVVIGGGIIGATTALELAERGHSVLLCEKGQLAGEQSSRNWGWVRLSQRDPRELALMMQAFPLWEGLEARTGQRTGYTTSGIVYTARTARREAQLERWSQHLRDLDLPGGMLRGQGLDALLPGYGGRLRSGFHTPFDGRAEPQWATHAIATGAQAAGATIVTGCAVRRLDVEGGAISGVVTEKGRVRATAVVVAGGAWSRLFLRNEGIFLPQLKVLNSVMRLSGVDGIPDTTVWSRGFSIRKRADGGFTVAGGGNNVVDLVPDLLRLGPRFLPAYLRDMGNVRLRMGDRWGDEVADSYGWGAQDRSPFERTRVLDPKPWPTAIRKALAAARDAFPVLEQADVTQSWGGLIDVTPDEIPVISEVPTLPGLFVSTGYSGHGFGIGPAAGKLTADLVTGDPAIVDPTPFALSRFTRKGRRAAPEAVAQPAS
ncbi:Sarcosine oxidase subunit beta [Tritonibacter multivorans]|uniref:Sarcosine oxidase subunit beta n=1 Tax=Tritonibacter multivorans TaxID=928856 RepID=A0A0P1G6F6_9RHOB|nr:FAD-binding oxidoreductase [Tritonibacter multivorans]MDA7422798.1 FAD-binding oxidoreductase [Tritonibacter multivorans]CUH77325.1 Sarcosine oxidase subunit beta [Tritonibacter multivorans]SFD59557.1 Glycine/D-amino acid oxidase [Tritonibacter multivorans]